MIEIVTIHKNSTIVTNTDMDGIKMLIDSHIIKIQNSEDKMLMVFSVPVDENGLFTANMIQEAFSEILDDHGIASVIIPSTINITIYKKEGTIIENT